MIISLAAFNGSLVPDIGPSGTEIRTAGYLPPIPDRTVLFDQAYAGIMDNAGQGDGLYLRADDFVLSEAGCIESIEWWSIFISGQSGTFHLRIFADSSGLPGTLLWEVPAISSINTDTGDDFNGSYDIYHSEVNLDPADYFTAEGGTTYWFSMYYSGTGFYWGLLTEGGNMALYYYYEKPWSSLEWIGMFRLSGSHTGAIMNETTWATIKAGI